MKAEKEMKQKNVKIGNIPAVLLGDTSEKVYLFVHGLGGNKMEAEAFAEIAVPAGWQVLGIDLPEHGERAGSKEKLLPWEVVPELLQVKKYVSESWKRVAIRANSIGAWFCMLAFPLENIEKCLFVSPILDMEQLIKNMMQAASVREEELEQKQIIETGFGQPLSWKYLMYARQHKIPDWNIPTEILYGTEDNMTDRDTEDEFVRVHHCGLTVMEQGEHWFHTPEQVRFMAEWEQGNL